MKDFVHGRVLVTGGSHSGGNWVMEIIRASECFHFYEGESVEDRALFQRNLWPGYATKLAIGNAGLYWVNLRQFAKFWSDMKFIFMTRHPVDTCLAKVVRATAGHIPHNWEYPWDCTKQGSVVSVEIVYDLFCCLRETFPERVLWVKMENLILNTEKTCRSICEFLGIKFREDMLKAHRFVRNRHQQERYRGEIQTSQMDMWRRWNTIHGGFYQDKEFLVRYFWEKLFLMTLNLEYPTI